jgi:hypothetical protein
MVNYKIVPGESNNQVSHIAIQHRYKKAKILQLRTTLQCPFPELFHPPHQGVTSNQVSLAAGANAPYFYYQLDSQ